MPTETRRIAASGIFYRLLIGLAGIVLTIHLESLAFADAMPEGFVHLRTLAPDIEQDIRYAGRRNFTGARLPGYRAAECVLVEEAADALRKVQAALKPDDLGLKVFDCYRPTGAVAKFVRWSGLPADPKRKTTYFPRLAKKDLFPTYIARRSGHSRGASVDLTLIDLTDTGPLAHGKSENDTVCGSRDDTIGRELDMGTGFDCFDPLSQTNNADITAEQHGNRLKLLQVMQKHGFKNYPGEWWHFTYHPEPYPKTYFDFPITPIK